MLYLQRLNILFGSKPQIKIVILIVLAFLPICVFYSTLFSFTVNVPYWDDYDALLNFTSKFHESSLHDKITLIFSQHNEHRIVLSRVVTLVSSYLTGKINFKFLTLLGDLSLFGLLILFICSSFVLRKKLLFGVLLILLLFHPMYWGDICFATPSLTHVLALFLACASLYLLKSASIGYYILSLLLAVLVTFTDGNGMFVFFAALPMLLYQKRYRATIIWVCVGIGCILFYFHGYVKPAYHPSISDALFIHPAETMAYFFCLLGGSFTNFGFNQVALYGMPLFVGIAIGAYFLFLIKIKYYKQNIVISTFLLFLILTSCVIAFSRSGFGVFPSRYKILSVVILVLCCLSIIEITPDKKMQFIFPALLSCAVLFSLFSYRNNINYVILQKKYLLSGLLLWKESKRGLSYPDQNRADSILSTAIAKGYYSLPAL